MTRLEWAYNPEVEKKVYDFDDGIVKESEDGDFEGTVSGVVDSSQSLKRMEF